MNKPTNRSQQQKAAALAWTFVLTTLTAGALYFGCSNGLNNQSPWSRFVQSVDLGLSLVVPLALGAWASLRDRAIHKRFALPVLLLIAAYLAHEFGVRFLNSYRAESGYGFSALFNFCAAVLVFSTLRRFCGWKIGPSEVHQPLRLPDLFAWTAIVALCFAVARWFDVPLQALIPSVQMLFPLAIAMLTSLLAAAVVGFVMEYPRRRVAYATSVGLTFALVWIFFVWNAGAFKDLSLMGRLTLIILQSVLPATVFIIASFWSYRDLGFEFSHQSTIANGKPRWRWQLVTVLLLLIYCVVGWGTYGSRRQELRRHFELWAQWQHKGIEAMYFVEDRVSQVRFSHEFPLTEESVLALAEEPISYIYLDDLSVDLEHFRRLLKRSTLKTVRLEGEAITDSHIRELQGCTGLTDIILLGVSPEPELIIELQDALPNCNVINR